MANGTPVTFGGGFAHGFTGGVSAGNEIVRTLGLKDEIAQRRQAARIEVMDKAFQRSLETVQLFQPIIEAAQAQPGLFAEGTANRQMFDMAIGQLRASAEATGRDPTVADQIGQALLGQTEIRPEVEAESPIGKLIKDRNTFQEGTPERDQIEQAIAKEIKDNPDTVVVQTRAPNGDQVTLLVDKQSGATVAELGKGPSVEFQPTKLPATKQQEIKERSDVLQQGIEQVRSLLALPKGTFGAGASVKRGVRGVVRVTGELVELGLPDEVIGPLKALAELGSSLIDRAIGQGRLDADTAAEFARSDLTEAESVEIQLAFLVANALQPDGKLLKDSISSARDIVKLSGLTAEETARERLATVLNILERSQRGLKGSADLSKGAGEKPASGGGGTKRFRFNPETNELEPLQ